MRGKIYPSTEQRLEAKAESLSQRLPIGQEAIAARLRSVLIEKFNGSQAYIPDAAAIIVKEIMAPQVHEIASLLPNELQIGTEAEFREAIFTALTQDRLSKKPFDIILGDTVGQIRSYPKNYLPVPGEI